MTKCSRQQIFGYLFNASNQRRTLCLNVKKLILLILGVLCIVNNDCICSPFRGEGDSCVCGCVYGKGKAGSIIHKYLLGVIGFITDFYAAIACCACRTGISESKGVLSLMAVSPGGHIFGTG